MRLSHGDCPKKLHGILGILLLASIDGAPNHFFWQYILSSKSIILTQHLLSAHFVRLLLTQPSWCVQILPLPRRKKQYQKLIANKLLWLQGGSSIDGMLHWQKEKWRLTEKIFLLNFCMFCNVKLYVWSLCSKTQCMLTEWKKIFSVNAQITLRIDRKNLQFLVDRMDYWPKVSNILAYRFSLTKRTFSIAISHFCRELDQ